jgi:hypothetical protein
MAVGSVLIAILMLIATKLNKPRSLRTGYVAVLAVFAVSCLVIGGGLMMNASSLN